MARGKSSKDFSANDILGGLSSGVPVEAVADKKSVAPVEADTVKPKREKWKNKTISAKVNNDLWEDFKKCARLKGASCNGLISMFISDYVNKTKKELQDLGLL